MSQIRILSLELRNKIAAGEVIERPASVAKELIENSIDAGSTEIKIEILHGGKGLIKVADNGSGMDRDDALLCLERHATSKLKGEEDLFNIKTMGFRGEALPSIASVSRMRLVTGLKDLPSGVSIESEGGRIKEVKTSPALGTSLEIRDLFFNTPARRKFLKSDSTELFHIIDAVTKEALSHWEIGFRLFTEKQETMALPKASGQKERILQIYGPEFVEELIEVSSPPHPLSEYHNSPFPPLILKGGLRLTAFVSKGTNFRNNRSHQFIFLNRRPVKDQTISHAVYEAYEGILPHDKHPVFFIFLDIDREKVDVNVHPTKREVRFENRQEIHRFVSASIREAVRSERASYIAPFTEAVDLPSSLLRDHTTPQPPVITPPSPSYFKRGRSEGVLSGGGVLGEGEPAGYISENVEFRYQPFFPFLYLGDTFVALAGKGGLTLIDHHAAHERILYEALTKGIRLNSNLLLFPKQIKLSHKEYKIILENKNVLHEMGMEIDDFGHDTVIVRSLPEALKEADIRGILSDAASTLLDGARPFDSLKEGLAATIACHGSVRGKEILGQQELQALLSGLENTENPDQCPHGRPTRLFFSLDDLKKMFKRK